MDREAGGGLSYPIERSHLWFELHVSNAHLHQEVNCTAIITKVGIISFDVQSNQGPWINQSINQSITRRMLPEP